MREIYFSQSYLIIISVSLLLLWFRSSRSYRSSSINQNSDSKNNEFQILRIPKAKFNYFSSFVEIRYIICEILNVCCACPCDPETSIRALMRNKKKITRTSMCEYTPDLTPPKISLVMLDTDEFWRAKISYHVFRENLPSTPESKREREKETEEGTWEISLFALLYCVKARDINLLLDSSVEFCQLGCSNRETEIIPRRYPLRPNPLLLFLLLLHLPKSTGEMM